MTDVTPGWYADNALSIGRTPLVRLNRVAGGTGATVLAKIEGRNPAYSVKCRIGAALVWDAEKRGVLKPGMKADVNIIDFAKLGFERPTMKFDLPAGGRRLLQQARGYTATIKAGRVTYRDGQATGALPGTLVRGAQPA